MGCNNLTPRWNGQSIKRIRLSTKKVIKSKISGRPKSSERRIQQEKITR